MKKKLTLLFLLFTSLIILTSCNNKNNKIIVYGDYKCPYCAEVEKKIMPKLKKDYIDKNKANYQFINMAFLGKDSIKGSRATHAVKYIAPNKALEFQKLMFSKQPNNEHNWITYNLIDEQIDKLDITKKKKKQIKKSYKTKNSKAWKEAKKDQKKSEDKNIEEAPTVFINGKKLKDPYTYEEYQKYLR